MFAGHGFEWHPCFSPKTRGRRICELSFANQNVPLDRSLSKSDGLAGRAAIVASCRHERSRSEASSADARGCGLAGRPFASGARRSVDTRLRAGIRGNHHRIADANFRYPPGTTAPGSTAAVTDAAFVFAAAEERCSGKSRQARGATPHCGAAAGSADCHHRGTDHRRQRSGSCIGRAGRGGRHRRGGRERRAWRGRKWLGIGGRRGNCRQTGENRGRHQFGPRLSLRKPGTALGITSRRCPPGRHRWASERMSRDTGKPGCGGRSDHLSTRDGTFSLQTGTRCQGECGRGRIWMAAAMVSEDPILRG